MARALLALASLATISLGALPVRAVTAPSLPSCARAGQVCIMPILMITAPPRRPEGLGLRPESAPSERGTRPALIAEAL